MKDSIFSGSVIVVTVFMIIAITVLFFINIPAIATYNVGDCVVDGRHRILKILEVGKYGYKTVDSTGYSIIVHSNYGGLNRTDCFDLFDKFKGDK